VVADHGIDVRTQQEQYFYQWNQLIYMAETDCWLFFLNERKQLYFSIRKKDIGPRQEQESFIDFCKSNKVVHIATGIAYKEALG